MVSYNDIEAKGPSNLRESYRVLRAAKVTRRALVLLFLWLRVLSLRPPRRKPVLGGVIGFATKEMCMVRNTNKRTRIDPGLRGS